MIFLRYGNGMKKIGFILIVFMITLQNSFAAVSTAVATCPDFPQFNPKNGPLSEINCDFHHAYEARIAEILKTFGEPGGRPIILNLGGTLVLKYNGKSSSQEVTPVVYHKLKSFSHVIFSIFLILTQQTPGPLTIKTHQELKEILQHAELALQTIPDDDFSPEENNAVRKLIATSQQFLTVVLRKNTYSVPLLQTYYQLIRPTLFEMVALAGKAEIKSLDQAINPWLKEIKPEDRHKLGVVVAVSHQARAEEISLQYFAKKLKFPYGGDARNENGLVVLEGHFDQASALALLARHYLDRDAARVILGDEARLQRDILSGAAHNILKKKSSTQ